MRFGGIRAVDQVSFELRSGEILGLIGPNGAGKTTLFDVLSGVRAPSSGMVFLGGRNVTARSSMDRARWGMRRTFQRVQTFGWLTVEENVLVAMEWRGGGGGVLGDLVGWPGRNRRERNRREVVGATLKRCGLDDIRDELAGSLPIGVGRMVELARAIADAPSVLLLDEPASGLAEVEAARLGDLIQEVRRETGCAVMLIEHNAGFVMQHCDRIIVLDQGSVIATGLPMEIQHNQVVRDAYLGDSHTVVGPAGRV